MNHSLADFYKLIGELSVSEAQKEELCAHGARFQKELGRLDFQMNRTLKDKSIVINLLNTTIDELRSQQKQTEASNIELQAQKRLVEEQSMKLAENLRMLEKSYAELEQFSYIASHDLKSPLRTIASYAGLLKRRYVGQLDPEAIDFVDYIVNGASHMNEIIRDLLEYAGITREQQFEELDLNETIGLVNQNLAAEIRETRASVDCQKLPVLAAHKTGMLQLFQNLVANAIKFRGNEPPAITIQCQERLRFWQFTVADNGLGLDESYQEKAFQPFQRINHLDRPGTGMGLAICHKIVKMHKGDIWFKSTPGNGTTFYFTISKDMRGNAALAKNEARG